MIRPAAVLVRLACGGERLLGLVAVVIASSAVYDGRQSVGEGKRVAQRSADGGAGGSQSPIALMSTGRCRRAPPGSGCRVRSARPSALGDLWWQLGAILGVGPLRS